MPYTLFIIIYLFLVYDNIKLYKYACNMMCFFYSFGLSSRSSILIF
jgi:hypothetical protein